MTKQDAINKLNEVVDFIESDPVGITLIDKIKRNREECLTLTLTKDELDFALSLSRLQALLGV